MTKAQHQQAVRLRPIGRNGIIRLRQIVAERQHAKINETAVDLWSASCVLAVYDACSGGNKEKLEAMPVHRVVSVCLQLMAKR